MSKIIIIGAGAAGMMAAIASNTDTNEVILIEKNKIVGKKLYITGKGRCNITNASEIEDIIKNIVRNGRFLYTAMYTYSNDMVIDFFNSNKLETKVERGNRVFPASDKASDVVATLYRAVIKNGVKVITNTSIEDIIVENGKALGVRVKGAGAILADRLIIATGGNSYKGTGSDGFGIKLLGKLGHKIIKTTPSLTSFVVDSIEKKQTKEFFSNLSGLSLKNVALSTLVAGRTVHKEFGELLFTHYGLSGPIVLTTTAMISGKYNFPLQVSLDLKPALDFDTLDRRLLRDIDKDINKNIINVIKSLLPIKLVEPILEMAGVNPYKKANSITKKERHRLLNTIKGMQFNIAGFKGNDAVVTRGGVDVKEVDPHTMESRIIKGLYIAGEMLDIDALTGGYNLQVAWSTGYLAGINASYS